MTWFWLLTLPLHSASASVPLVLNVEADVSTVTLTCPTGSQDTKPEVNGQVSFDIVPTNCDVSLTKRIGQVNSVGEYMCDSRGCTLQVPPHKPVQDADGRVNLIFLDSGNASMIELSCSGYRERSKIYDFTAVFDDVPKDECTVYAKGGTTAKSQPLGWGTYACTISGPTLICQKYIR